MNIGKDGMDWEEGGGDSDFLGVRWMCGSPQSRGRRTTRHISYIILESNEPSLCFCASCCGSSGDEYVWEPFFTLYWD
jgi:hypothetical protein